MKRKESIINILPTRIRAFMLKEELDFDQLEEIRMRTGRPLLFRYGGKERTLLKSPVYVVQPEDIRETLQYASGYSLYAYEHEMGRGYMTTEGGHRIGMAGQAIREGEDVTSLKYISSINIRIAHQIVGCAEPYMEYLFDEDKLQNTLIISPPGCGKTTLLRDFIRQISDGSEYMKGISVGVVDERSEIGGSYMGMIQNDLGIRTDLLDACPKAEGMMMLIRSMSPRMIAVDEIGSEKELKAIRHALNCGCNILATVHGNSIEDVRKKPGFGEIFDERIFRRFVVLKAGKHPGQLEGIYDETGERIC